MALLDAEQIPHQKDKRRHDLRPNNIRILERVSLAQDKGLVIAEICGGVYLLSFSNERVEILKELDRDQLKQPKKPCRSWISGMF